LTEGFLNLTGGFLTLTEDFQCFFLSCKANARVKLAKTGHTPHSSILVVFCVVRLLFVLFYVLFVCKCVLPPGNNPIAVNKYIISYCLITRLKDMYLNILNVKENNDGSRRSLTVILILKVTEMDITAKKERRYKTGKVYKGKGKGKGHPCTGTEALYRPYGP